MVLPEVGEVMFYKRKGVRNIKLSVTHDGIVRVSMPYWLPYASAIPFVNGKSKWIIKQRISSNLSFNDGQKIGKLHKIILIPDPGIKKPTGRIKSESIVVKFPTTLGPQDQLTQKKIREFIQKALKAESYLLLDRLNWISKVTGIEYKSSSTRLLKTRWGSCNSKKEIVLSTHLIQLPWDLIDYVIMHELTHIKHLNHSKSFWSELEIILPNYKSLRKELKKYHPYGESGENPAQL